MLGVKSEKMRFCYFMSGNFEKAERAAERAKDTTDVDLTESELESSPAANSNRKRTTRHSAGNVKPKKSVKQLPSISHHSLGNIYIDVEPPSTSAPIVDQGEKIIICDTRSIILNFDLATVCFSQRK